MTDTITSRAFGAIPVSPRPPAMRLRILGAALGLGVMAVALVVLNAPREREAAALPAPGHATAETEATPPPRPKGDAEAGAGQAAPRPRAAGLDLDEMGHFRPSGALVAVEGWMFAPFSRRAAAAAPDGGESVSVEAPGPRPAPRVAAAIDDPEESAEIMEEAVAPPLPTRNPLLRAGRRMASLPPADRPLEAAPRLPRSQVALPGPGDRYALYDITGKTVYMPSGERLEAHSGYGASFDDPRAVAKRMRGPTPPNTYKLVMREALFHGVEAVRMLPTDRSRMYGRDGILAHSYMLGPRGDSNGCVSFRDYPRFLSAFKRGEVTQMVVVAALETPPLSPLLSWLAPKQ
ncbi:DUF2778 domain-containing protein [Aquabacter spiritensis]|nr:DUF2778 domain-containing protein [Aquabacter spiritensis]